ncbi:endonuclease/exonuclease/phosphatase family protein [Phycicoccus sp. Soil802]|uniref:endonuclease/exonuclease/phosphatase family protein n=1 Tax=Phycicoccus sp. Soil802 TaxID=1736414 RepID=UPI000712418C|nr:endonuclease/exonuclease/phosphatase family protein [Phycicoccus sp. Soil802]KRF29492.1 hypothetical protein ASG91_00185 [Phycicoccus sp. Soil802]
MSAPSIRVGTWNLAGRWSAAHAQMLKEADCDVWLLTEVHPDTAIPGFHAHRGAGRIVGQRAWAAILSRERLEARSDPHGASAAAAVSGTVFCSTVLPWRSCRSVRPWSGSNHAAKTGAALVDVLQALPRDQPVVWGGDWNHALSGREYAGSAAGREHLITALREMGLVARTEDQPHRIEGLLSIDHIAAPAYWQHRPPRRIPVDGLSDHDAYTVSLMTPAAAGH